MPKRKPATLADVTGAQTTTETQATDGDGAPARRRSRTTARKRRSADETEQINARVLKELRDRLTAAVFTVNSQLVGDGGQAITLRDILEVALEPLLDDLDKSGGEAELLKRLRKR